jgi:putative N6-adenine-specific DNA methylase
MNALFYAPCPKGLETYMRAEVLAYGGTLEADLVAGVRFRADAKAAMRLTLESRLASRLMEQVAHGTYAREDDIYALARTVAWDTWHDENASLRIDITANQSPLKSLQFAALRVKDAICDHHRDLTGTRPNVDTLRPMRRIFVHLNVNEVTLYLDWSGESMFKRGWRLDKREAPIKENLAAGLLDISGYRDAAMTDPIPLIDPFCGSGTIAIEAAQMALGMAPGLQRRFACERFRPFNRGAWDALREELTERQNARFALLKGEQLVQASDVSIAAMAAADQNAQRAGLPKGAVRWRQLDAVNLKRTGESGLFVTNPPYGERIEQGGSNKEVGFEEFWGDFGRVLKGEFAGWNACILSPDKDLPKGLRMDARKRTPVFNGAIECRLFRFELYAGSRKAPRLDNA